MKISVNCPSWKRPVVKTLQYLPFCKVWVDGRQYEDYRKANPGANIIVCPDGVQGNLCRVRNYIMRTEFEGGADVVVIVDDDYSGMAYFVPDGAFGYVSNNLNGEDFLPFVEKYSIMAIDMGVYFWGVNCNIDHMCCRHSSPFSTKAYIGGPFQVFIKGNRCYYDERLPLKEDYDMTLQQLNVYRKVLRVNWYHYIVKQSEQAGGCAEYRNREREQEQFKLLQRKWGSNIVKRDTSNKGKTRKEKKMDYNPIIKIPIKGI